MPRIEDIPSIPRRVLPVFYVIDTSSNMAGQYISQINAGLKAACAKYAEDFGSKQANMHLKIAVLSCGDRPCWMYNELLGIEKFNLKPLSTGGKMNMGAALRELNSKLSENAFLTPDSGYFTPFIIFISDSHSADDYILPLRDLIDNDWFMRSNKLSLLSRPTADAEMMILLAGGDVKSVARVDDYSLISQIL